MPAESTFLLTQSQIDSLAEQLREAERDLVNGRRAFGDAEIWTFRESSFNNAITSLESFISDFKKSVRAHQSGEPWGPDTQKKRSPKKKPTPPPKKSEPPRKTVKKRSQKK